MWDHIAIDPASKLVVAMVQGPHRDQETSDRLVTDFADRTNGRPPELVTTDEHAAYETSLLEVYGIPYRPRRKGGTRPEEEAEEALAEGHEPRHRQEDPEEGSGGGCENRPRGRQRGDSG
ncbi:MAG: hypothetical protein HQL82_10535 [Magnetococcales bacterium]|nr:hypothetical protein [Magnetococcales bacterium]